MMMRIYALLLIVAGCWGVEWKAANEFKDTFKEFSVALNTISSIENILNVSGIDSEQFLNKTFTENPLWNKMAEIRLLSSRFEFFDPCHEKIINEDDIKLSYQIQIYQIQVPLRSRAVDIRERLNNVSSSLDIYQGLAESKYLSCKMLKGECLEETNEWLASNLGSLKCEIYPNCSKHSIRKRATCSKDTFRCSNADCIAGSKFCNGVCDCGGCDDEPFGCVKNCSEFRCNVTFRCVSKSKKCDRINDCGDWSDEDGCALIANALYTPANCPMELGHFFCKNSMCISLERICDGFNDCGDWSDEGDHCSGRKCSPMCSRKGGVCFTDPKGSRCLYECPPGTYEAYSTCSRFPEAPLPTLIQILEDTPRLVTRYAARLKYLKLKTILALSHSLRELVNCKQNEYTLLSKMIDFSPVIHDEGLSEVRRGFPGTIVNVTSRTPTAGGKSKDNPKQPPKTQP